MFLKIMRELSEAAFGVLFEFAQMSVRVDGASGHRDPFERPDTLRENDSHLRKTLEDIQSEILDQNGIDMESLMIFQDHFICTDEEIRAVVETIPHMFSQYTSGSFPTLPESIWPRPNVSDDDLLNTVRDYYTERIEAMKKDSLEQVENGISTELKNLVAYRVNESADFKQRLLLLVIDVQSTVRSQLE